MKQKKFITILFYFSIIFLVTQSCTKDEENTNSDDCRDTNCSNYSSQSAAQAAYDANPECRNDLDRNNNGVACEEPGNTIKTCTSTSNCGCSGKKKSECARDACCRWIVGTGCKCS